MIHLPPKSAEKQKDSRMLETSPHALSPGANHSGTPKAPALRILVVDDLVDAAEALGRLLRYDQHEVRTCYRATEAVALAQEFLPDVVLLDIGLPELDGYAVAQRMRERPSLRAARIIAVTGFSPPGDGDHGSQSGIDRYLLKPVQIGQLQAILAEFFPR
jgi:CheY-like chemotaxis protein